MPQHNTLEVCRVDLFTAREVLEDRYPLLIVASVLIILEKYNWYIFKIEANELQLIICGKPHWIVRLT